MQDIVQRHFQVYLCLGPQHNDPHSANRPLATDQPNLRAPRAVEDSFSLPKDTIKTTHSCRGEVQEKILMLHKDHLAKTVSTLLSTVTRQVFLPNRSYDALDR